MNLRLVASCGFVCSALILSGCDSGRQAPGKVTVQVVNAAPRFASLQFQREQSDRELEELFFRDATQNEDYWEGERLDLPLYKIPPVLLSEVYEDLRQVAVAGTAK